MKQDVLLELASRCEAATGADRGLDIAIEDALEQRLMPWRPNPFDWLVKIGGVWCETERYGKGGSTQDSYCQRYTASLDAAMTLYVRVPERIPSNPRLAAAEALRQRAEHV